jgi:hypothetical protein
MWAKFKTNFRGHSAPSAFRLTPEDIFRTDEIKRLHLGENILG